jgi:glycosyltransferase involved in cell wall biosynthesis
MSDLKILFLARPDLLTHTGGDTIQILKTKEYLEKLGNKVDLISDIEVDFTKYDLAHLFNLELSNFNFQIARILISNKIPYVISPIYWDSSEYYEKVIRKISLRNKIYHLSIKNRFIEKYLHKIFPDANKSSISYKKRKYCLENATSILPNSYEEQKILENKFRIFGKYEIIPNAVDLNIIPGDYKQIKMKYELPDEYFLCVGRIEYRKNQIPVIKAAKEINTKLVLVGAVNAKENKYWRRINRLYKNDFIHIEKLEHKDLFLLYRNAEAHILPSWFETPGLVSLEAAYNNCQIISTDRGCTREYFGEDAFYCDPDDFVSIKSAMIESISNPKNLGKLQKTIIDNYTWEIAAEKTLGVYIKTQSSK